MKKIFSALCILFLNFYSIGQGKPERIPNGYSVQTIDTPKEVSFGVGGMEFAPSGDLSAPVKEMSGNMKPKRKYGLFLPMVYTKHWEFG